MDRAPTLHIYAASGHKKLRPRSPGRLGAGDKHSIEAAEGIPALLIQRPGFRTVIQMLNPLDVCSVAALFTPETSQVSTPFRTRDSPQNMDCTRLR